MDRLLNARIGLLKAYGFVSYRPWQNILRLRKYFEPNRSYTTDEIFAILDSTCKKDHGWIETRNKILDYMIQSNVLIFDDGEYTLNEKLKGSYDEAEMED